MNIEVGQIYMQPFTSSKYTMRILEIKDCYVKWMGLLGYEHTTFQPILELFIKNDGWILSTEKEIIENAS